MSNQLLDVLGYDGLIDVLGISWGGSLAQQFAHLDPDRCRRLILASTSPGAIMVPGKPSGLSKMISPRRYSDPDFLHKVGGELYGGRLPSQSGAAA
jgi:pimeloyl-ACP methyl ester carboxylesterase